MKFHGGKEIAVTWVEPGSSSSQKRAAKYARVIAEEEIQHDPDICRKTKRLYVLDNLNILLELTAVETYDPHFIGNWPLPRGRQIITKARVIDTPTGHWWGSVSGFSCPEHGEYTVALMPDAICSCCALEKLI